MNAADELRAVLSGLADDLTEMADELRGFHSLDPARLDALADVLRDSIRPDLDRIGDQLDQAAADRQPIDQATAERLAARHGLPLAATPTPPLDRWGNNPPTDARGRETVDCGQADCLALTEPGTLDEWMDAHDHWRDHGFLSGCSHGH